MKSLDHHPNPASIIDEYYSHEMPLLTEKAQEILENIAAEDFDYFVIDRETVVVTDYVNGDIVNTQTLEEFWRDTREYIAGELLHCD